MSLAIYLEYYVDAKFISMVNSIGQCTDSVTCSLYRPRLILHTLLNQNKYLYVYIVLITAC